MPPIPLADLASGAAAALPRRPDRSPPRAGLRPARRGPARAGLPRGGRRRQGGRLGRLRRAPPPRARGLRVADRAARELQVARPRGGRRPGQARPLRRQAPRHARRRDRPRARRLATGRRRRRTRPGRRRLVRAARRQLGPVRAGVRARPGSLVRAEAADDQPRHRRRRGPGRPRPTARSGWPGRRGSTARPRSSRPPSRARRRPSTSATTRPTTGPPPSRSTGRGRVHVAFDSYRAGNYDVFLAPDVASDGQARSRPVAVADSSRFEARPEPGRSTARGGAWVGYEERAANWGKDFGRASRRRGLRALRHQRGAGPLRRRRQGPRRRRPARRRGRGRAADEQPCPAGLRRRGPDLAARSATAQEAVLSDVVMVAGGVWLEYATCLVGPGVVASAAVAPQRRPARQPPRARRHARRPGPRLLQHRQPDAPRGRAHPRARAEVPRSSGDAPGHGGQRPVRRGPDGPGDRAPGEPTPGGPVAAERAVPPVHPDEAADVARDARLPHRGRGARRIRLLRGEFHRHTEISFDGGNDGTLEDMWRYAIDAGGSTGSATATTTTAAARSTPGGSSRRPPTSTTTRPPSCPCSPTSGA